MELSKHYANRLLRRRQLEPAPPPAGPAPRRAAGCGLPAAGCRLPPRQGHRRAPPAAASAFRPAGLGPQRRECLFARLSASLAFSRVLIVYRARTGKWEMWLNYRSN